MVNMQMKMAINDFVHNYCLIIEDRTSSFKADRKFVKVIKDSTTDKQERESQQFCLKQQQEGCSDLPKSKMFNNIITNNVAQRNRQTSPGKVHFVVGCRDVT